MVPGITDRPHGPDGPDARVDDNLPLQRIGIVGQRLAVLRVVEPSRIGPYPLRSSVGASFSDRRVEGDEDGLQQAEGAGRLDVELVARRQLMKRSRRE